MPSPQNQPYEEVEDSPERMQFTRIDGSQIANPRDSQIHLSRSKNAFAHVRALSHAVLQPSFSASVSASSTDGKTMVSSTEASSIQEVELGTTKRTSSALLESFKKREREEHLVILHFFQ